MMILHPPFMISSRLLPAVKIDDATISLELVPSNEPNGRQRVRWYFDAPGIEESAADITGLGPLQEFFMSTLSFMGACAETVGYARRQGRELDPDNDNSGLFPPSMHEWLDQHEDEISMMQCEIEDSGRKLIEE